MSKRTRLFSLVFSLMIAASCDTTSNTNIKVNGNTVANNTAVVMNNNANTMVNTNKELTRADFDKDKAKYEAEAKDEKSTIGTGANDLWLWTKTRAALAGVDELRDSTINVDVDNDVVTLKGTVGTAAEKDAAVKAAKAVEGVKDVKDALKVDAKDSMTLLLPAVCVDRRECPNAEFVGDNSEGCSCYKCNKGQSNEITLCFKN